MENTINEEFRFEEFVLSVIRQKCVNENKRFFAGAFDFSEGRPTHPMDKFSDRNFPFDKFSDRPSKGMDLPFEKFPYDGYAPDGFDDFDLPVIIEVKHTPRNSVFKPLIEGGAYISLYVISTSEKGVEKKIRGERVVVWGQETIAEWEKLYPIDYYAYTLHTAKELEQVADLLDFRQKNESNKELLRRRIADRSICFSLGAGVSIEYGARSWENLINDFYKEIRAEGKIDDIVGVRGKIGGTSIINGQFAQDNLRDFMSSLYKGLYVSMKMPLFYSATTLHYIARLASLLCRSPRFNIITYNYDDILEQLLNAEGVRFKTIYREEDMPDDALCVYHPHGFLPASAKKADYPQYKNHIIFGESEYHRLYNDPLSWAMVLQQYLYRINTYLFVGCSMTDPNLRRILENTRLKAKSHYALMLTDGLSKKDQFTVHKHFMRMGVECIWYDALDDLKAELSSLASML